MLSGLVVVASLDGHLFPGRVLPFSSVSALALVQPH